MKPIYLPYLHKVKYAYKNLIFKSNGDYVLGKISEILNQNGYFFWLDYGTLLGIYRDGKLIKHDVDIDIAMFYSANVKNLMAVLEENGFKFVRKIFVDEKIPALEYTFRMKNINIDIFFYSEVKEKFITYLFPNDRNGRMIVNELAFTKYKFKKIIFRISGKRENRFRWDY